MQEPSPEISKNYNKQSSDKSFVICWFTKISILKLLQGRDESMY